MNKLEIKIGNQVVELKFNFGVLRLLSEKWGIQSVTDLFIKIGSLGDGEVTMNKLSMFGDIVWAAAKKGGEEIDPDDVVGVLLEQPEKMQEIMFEFMKSMPQPTEEQKKTAAQTKAKK
ncbi:hypothetical protein AV926_04925 [Myroides marinus]|uniref:Uncharacterized protein n=1 Tax=Myroides marinus TaxID=703342 RepID=A0A161SL50_9FLAO|nr:hypothetical protein [Myroides marinus]KZE82895.1 hypothetical protein AV926_04925 [Myroides marinus]